MSTSSSTGTTTIGTMCTNYNGGQVTITVPSNGMIMVSAQVYARINHASGTTDFAYFNVGGTPTDCSGPPYWWPHEVPAGAPTAIMNVGVFAQRPFVVTAGTYTFYMNALMTFGQDALDVFWYSNMVAVFYPS